MILDTSGPTSTEPFATFDQDSSSWRMCAGTSRKASAKSSVTFPTQGSMRSGSLFERPMLERRTDVSASLSLLGTPNAHPRTHSPRSVDHGIQLANQVALLPTPNAHESGSTPEAHLSRKPGRTKVTSLGSMARGGLLPTPTVNDSKMGRNDTANRSNPDSKHHAGTTLTDALLPTPTASMSTGPGIEGRDGGPNLQTTLLATPTARDWKDGSPCAAVEVNGLLGRQVWTLGDPTPPPSNDGKPSSDDRRLNPRFVEFMMGLPEGWVTDVPSPARSNSRRSATAVSRRKPPSPSPSSASDSSRPEEHKVRDTVCDDIDRAEADRLHAESDAYDLAPTPLSPERRAIIDAASSEMVEEVIDQTQPTHVVKAIHEWPTNGHLIADCARLGYLRDDWQILDPTFGKGVFWSVWRPEGLWTSDLEPGNALWDWDFTKIPQPDQFFDAVVFDPPYKLNGTPDATVDERYGVHIPTRWQDRMKLILDGTAECARVAKTMLLVKVMDQVVSGKIRWQTDEVTKVAERCGFGKVDRLEMVTGGRPQPEGRRQVHAHRSSSSLLVFKRGHRS